jgi:hypothetical protein
MTLAGSKLMILLGCTVVLRDTKITPMQTLQGTFVQIKYVGLQQAGGTQWPF